MQGLVGAIAGGSLSQVASSLSSGGRTFTAADIKRCAANPLLQGLTYYSTYFGNWLRDYSQAMDIGGLSKLTADSILLIVSVLGFLTFGYGTREFEVTRDRLAVYLLVEHVSPARLPAQT